jgi:hypothetical protein
VAPTILGFYSSSPNRLSIRSLYLIKRMFAPVVGLPFGFWSCYPAKLLFGFLQQSSEALDENTMLRSHIDLLL